MVFPRLEPEPRLPERPTRMAVSLRLLARPPPPAEHLPLVPPALTHGEEAFRLRVEGDDASFGLIDDRGFAYTIDPIHLQNCKGFIDKMDGLGLILTFLIRGTRNLHV